MDLPMLNHLPVPVISQGQHITLPDAWLNNANRTHPAPASLSLA